MMEAQNQLDDMFAMPDEARDPQIIARVVENHEHLINITRTLLGEFEVERTIIQETSSLGQIATMARKRMMERTPEEIITRTAELFSLRSQIDAALTIEKLAVRLRAAVDPVFSRAMQQAVSEKQQ